MKVPLSCMICMISSRWSERSQSSLRGSKAVSLEMMHLDCVAEGEGQAVERDKRCNLQFRLPMWMSWLAEPSDPPCAETPGRACLSPFGHQRTLP